MRTVIGVDLGGTNIVSVVMDAKGKVLGKDKRPTLAVLGSRKVLERIAESVRAASHNSGLPWSSHAAVGIGSPGPLDQKRGIVLYSPNLRWHNVPIVAILRRKLGKKVLLENDANAAALGESWLGAGKGEKVVLCVTLGTGVGGGVVLDGRIYQGASGVSNHVGHIVVDPKGPKAATGNRGILEMYPSTIGITRMAKEARLKVPLGGSYDPKTVVAMARKGNPAAKRILATAGQMLGVGLTSVIHIINPSVVIFSGGVSQAGELLFRPMRRELRERCFKSHLKGLKFRMARLGDNMGAVGAARLAWQFLDAEA